MAALTSDEMRPSWPSALRPKTKAPSDAMMAEWTPPAATACACVVKSCTLAGPPR